MRRLLLIFVLLLSSFASWSQNPVETLVSKLSSSTVSFSYSYVVKMQLSLRGSGSVSVCGSAFRMEGDGLVICCDGTTRWTADEQAKELIIELVVDGPSAFAVNPALMIGALDSTFTLTSQGGGSYTLIPKENSGIKLLKLNFKGDRLSAASMVFPDDIFVDLTISGMTFSEPSSPASFQYGPVDSSWVITDLR